MSSSDLAHLPRFAGVLSLAFALGGSAQAQSLGAIGPVYPVAEESALDTIMKRLKAKERTGELARIREAAIARSVNGAKNPPPVAGLATTQIRSQKLLDPTVTYEQAVKADDGRVVVPAGARINPLLVTSLTKRLVFFDGRDLDQLEAVRRMVAAAGATKLKPILVAGSWFDVTKAWKSQVFYDQQGTLSRRFGLTHVPAVVSQRGDMLLVEAIPAKELK